MFLRQADDLELLSEFGSVQMVLILKHLVMCCGEDNSDYCSSDLPSPARKNTHEEDFESG